MILTDSIKNLQHIQLQVFFINVDLILKSITSYFNQAR